MRTVYALGSIQRYAGEQRDGSLVCQACWHVITSAVNLENGSDCPYCHNSIHKVIDTDVLAYDRIADDDDPIAQPC